MLVPQPTRTSNPQDAIEKLRRLIRRKISEKARLLADIATSEAALAPLAEHQQTMETLDLQIHALFREALGNPKLSKRARRQVQELYEGLQDDQVISPDPERAKPPEEACTCPACAARAANDSPFEDMFGGDEPPPPGRKQTAPAPEKPARDAGLRALYHKLAFHFHPDRAGDEARRAEHEAVMREVNNAYHGGDTERLLELSRELGIEIGELQASRGLLGELVAQYEAIKAEVRALHDSPSGALVADRRRAERHGYRSRVEKLHEEIEGAVEQLTVMRDFVRDFAQGRMSLKTFLGGPSGSNPSDGDDEQDLFFEFVGMVEEMALSFATPRRPTRGKSKTTTRRGNR